MNSTSIFDLEDPPDKGDVGLILVIAFLLAFTVSAVCVFSETWIRMCKKKKTSCKDTTTSENDHVVVVVDHQKSENAATKQPVI